MVAAGDPVESADITTIEDETIRKPLVRLVQSVAQSVSDNTATALTFTTEDVDTHGYHDTAVNNTRVTPTLAGYYRCRGNAQLPSKTDYTTIYCTIAKNGTQQAPAERQAFGGTSAAGVRSVEAEATLTANGSTDYFEVQILQDNVGNTSATLNASGAFASAFEVEFIRPL